MGKANKKLARVLATMMSVTALISATACKPGTSNDGDGDGGAEATTTVIQIGNFGGGIGRKWMDLAGKRFAEAVKDVEYTPGKFGVSFEVVSTTGVKIKNAKEQGFHLFFVQGKFSDYYEEINKGDIMDISDVVTGDLGKWGEPGVTIEDKIPADYRFAFQGLDSKYYMLPHYAYLSGASYDVDMFTTQGLYLAKPDMGEEHTTDLLPGKTFYFTGDAAEKTVGNDGIAGTDDDGMPTTFDELIAQCDYIKSKRISVFSTAGVGAHIDYANYLTTGLWAALSGYEQREAVFTFQGDVDYVTGVSSEELWPGTGIMKPVIEKTTLIGDGSDGYKAVNQAGKYYAYAFFELAYQQGWFYKKVNESNYTHKEAMKHFILNGIGGMDKIASHIEGTYWYNEAEGYGLFNDYKVLSGGAKPYKNIAHWHMPTSVDGEVVTGPENAREETVVNATTSHILMNGNLNSIGGSEGTIQACKDFLQFICTDYELQQFTVNSGVAKSFYDYEITDEVLAELDPYQKTVMRLQANNPVINQYGNNNTYRAKSGILTYGANTTGWQPNFDGVTYRSPYEVYYKTGLMGEAKYKNAWACFERTGYSSDKWMNEVYVK